MTNLTSISEDGPEFTTEAGLHEHVDVFLVLEGLVQPKNLKTMLE